MIAFELREDYAGTVDQVLTVDENGDPVDTRTVPKYSGGVLRAGDESLNVGELLEQGNGRIVIDETTIEGAQAAVTLDVYPPLKRVPAGDEPATVDPLDGMNAAALRAEATRLDVDVAPGVKVAELRAGLKTIAAARAAGDEAYAAGVGRTVNVQPDGSVDVVATTTPEG